MQTSHSGKVLLKNKKLKDILNYKGKIVQGIYTINMIKLNKDKDGMYFIKVNTTDCSGVSGSRMAKFSFDEKTQSIIDKAKADAIEKAKEKAEKEKEKAEKEKQEKEENITTEHTYFVSKSGSNKNSGKTESKAFKTIAKGISKLSAGDTLVIKEGTYKEKLTLSKKGTSQSPIKIVGEGKVNIDGNNGKGTLLKIKGSKYITIENINFKNLNATEAKGVYIIPATSNITINKCNFSNIKCPNPTKNNEQGANAIFVKGTSSTPISNITISKCNLTNIGAGHSEVISVDGNCTDIDIKDTTVSSSNIKGNIGICICGHYNTCKDKKLDRPRNVTISNCNVSNCKSPYGDTAHGIYVDGGENVKIIDNTVMTCEGGIEIGAEKTSSAFSGRETEKITVKNNKIENCNYGVNIGGHTEKLGTVNNVTFDNNTLKNCGKASESIKTEMLTLAKCKNIKITNSTFSSKNKAKIIYNEMSSSYTKNITFNNNTYVNGGKSSGKYFTWHGKDYGFAKWATNS